MNATPYNLAPFGIMMLNEGKFNDKQVIQPAVIQKLAKGGSIAAFDKGLIYQDGHSLHPTIRGDVLEKI